MILTNSKTIVSGSEVEVGRRASDNNETTLRCRLKKGNILISAGQVNRIISYKDFWPYGNTNSHGF